VSRRFLQNPCWRGQIQRKSLEPELQNAGGAASSPTINTGEALNFVVTLLRLVAADESRRRTLLEAEWDEDDIFAAAVWKQMVALAVAELEEERVQGGSRKGNAPNMNRPFAETHSRFLLKYFWPFDQIRPDSSNEYGHRAPEEAFERRFRMPRVVFNRLFEKVVQQSQYFHKGLNPNAVGQTGITPLLKVIVAIRTLAYALPSNIADDMFEVSETTASMCLHEFARVVVQCFDAEYLREPTGQDLVRIEKQFK
jgi:hypothetical protein